VVDGNLTICFVQKHNGMSSVKLPVREFHGVSADDCWNTHTRRFILEGQRIETTWTIETYGVHLTVATSGMITTNNNFTDANSCQSAVTSVTRTSNILHSKLPHAQRQARILQIRANKANNRPLETVRYSSCCSPCANVAAQIQDSLGLSHFLTHGRPATSSPYCPRPESRSLQLSCKRLNTLRKYV